MFLLDDIFLQKMYKKFLFQFSVDCKHGSHWNTESQAAVTDISTWEDHVSRMIKNDGVKLSLIRKGLDSAQMWSNYQSGGDISSLWGIKIAMEFLRTTIIWVALRSSAVAHCVAHVIPIQSSKQQTVLNQ